jgi:asparagine synthase (glutamine-hydrolysing)
MLQGQRFYGSHAAQWDDGPYACGRLLHSSVPEDRFDHQPLTRGPHCLVCDLRLDNREDLAVALRLSTKELACKADSDLLFDALLRWGEGAVDKLVGEFAFAYWNETDRRLLLARDLVGHRPLYLHQGKGFFAFASMPSGLHALPAVPREFDTQVMAEWLALLPYNGPETHFRHIQQLEKGHVLEVTPRRTSKRTYWQPPTSAPQTRSFADHVEGLRAVVDTAVKSQLRGADGVVATQLSCGLDSSIVTATAARLFDPGKIVAFTGVPRAGFCGPVPSKMVADESRFAALTASLYPNVEHVRVEPGDETLISLMEKQAAYMQQPTPGPCNSVWARQISRAAAARGIKVMLVGFWGNVTVSYSGRDAWSSLFARGRVLKGLRIGARMASKGVPLRTLAAQLVGPLLPPPLWTLACRLYRRPIDLSGYSPLNPAMRAAVDAKARLEGIDFRYQPSNDPVANRLAGMFNGDVANYFKGTLGEFGLSMRDPLSDKRVIEFCLSVPPEDFLGDGTERSLARRAFADRLPPEVADLHLRGYQAADWFETIERDLPLLRKELDAISRSSAADAVDTNWIAETLDSWPPQDWAHRAVIQRYRYGLLRGISAGNFMRTVAGTN